MRRSLAAARVAAATASPSGTAQANWRLAAISSSSVLVSRGFSSASASSPPPPGAPDRGVNRLFRPEIRKLPGLDSKEKVATSDKTVIIDWEKHSRETWAQSEVREAAEKHALMTWGATTPMLKGASYPVRGEGVYWWDSDGKKFLDFNSQAMCISLGFTPPEEVREAIHRQLESLPYIYPGVSMTEIRARTSALLAEICPADLNTFMFPSTGMEANELAVRMCRLKTGRHKILSRFRSYHGSSTTTLSMTGDFRRNPVDSLATGHVRFFDPYPYSFSWGETPEQVTENSLTYLRELIESEGASTVAAIFLETITGTNGILPPPPGYLRGVRALCDEFGIMFVADEVMAGFGRSGKWFGFQHDGDDVIPDIFTAAKGINGAFLPLGCVGMRDHVADHFRENPVGGGSTYNAHPVPLASAYAALKYMVKNDVVGHAKRMEKHMIAGHERLIANHPSVKQARQVGLFGAFDLQKNHGGEYIGQVFEPPSPALLALKQEVAKNGLFTMMRGHNVFTNPPLIITPAQIEEGFDKLDASLGVVDALMED
jgi:adenosylmethionine-8-amino-7-oxononanoate aminotransferase